MGSKFIYRFGDSLGLSTGMMASNIVDELEYIFGHNADFKKCQNSAVNSEDAALACDLFWGGKWWQGAWIFDVFKGGNTEIGSVLRSWVPDLFSLVTASVVSLTIMQANYRGIGTVAAGTIIQSRFVQGLKIRIVQNIPIEALIKGKERLVLVPGWYVVKTVKGSVEMALWLVPVGIKTKIGGTILKGLLQTLKKFRLSITAPTALVQVTRSAVGQQKSMLSGPAPAKRSIWAGIKSTALRIINLLVFFKADEWLTSPAFNIMKDSMKAEELVNTIETFEQFYNDNSHTSHTICDYDSQQKPKVCRYHPRIVSLLRVGNGFNRWRLHQIEEAANAQMNWVQYISNAVGHFELTYDIYKSFFQSKKGSRSFNNISFLNNFDKSQILEIAQLMEEDIDIHFQDHPHIPVYLQSFDDVVAYSPSRFLQPDINWDRSEGYHLSVLAGLFGAAKDLTSPLDLFYQNWPAVFAEEEERIRKNLTQQKATDNFKDTLL